MDRLGHIASSRYIIVSPMHLAVLHLGFCSGGAIFRSDIMRGVNLYSNPYTYNDQCFILLL